MKQNITKTAVGILAILLLVSVTGCNNKKSAASGGKTSQGKIELRVLNYFDMTAASTAEEDDVVWKAFEKANPDIKIIREDLFNDPFHNEEP